MAEKHTKYVYTILEKLKENDLYTYPDKYSFYQRSIIFLKYIMTFDKVQMDQSYVSMIFDLHPSLFMTFKSFLASLIITIVL